VTATANDDPLTKREPIRSAFLQWMQYKAIIMIRILTAAGIGGTLPTLCRLAATYSVNPSQTAPTIGIYIAMALFFLIGMAVAFGFGESELRKAFALGIAGPAIVTSIFSGASQPHATVTARIDGATLNHLVSIFGVEGAYAETSDVRQAKAPTPDAPATRTRLPQLTVIPTLTGTGVTSAATPVALQFLTTDGKVVAASIVSPSFTSKVNVPAAATTVQASVAGASTTALLPLLGFQNAELRLKMVAAPSNDFLWALGAPRQSKITNLSASVSDVSAVSLKSAPVDPTDASTTAPSSVGKTSPSKTPPN
jgi:hypothetical protein